MIDIKLIRESQDEVKNNLKRRNNAEYLKILDSVIEKDKKWRTLQKKTDELRKKRNDVGASVAKLKKEGKGAEKEIKNMQKIASDIESTEKETNNVRSALDTLMLKLPNMLHESVPTGKDEDENKEIRKWGKIPEFGFKAKDHIDIGEALGLFDIERAAKVAGARFYYLKDDAVRLEFALVQYALDILAKEGFSLTIPPMILRERVMQGAGFLPAGEEDIYKIENNEGNERLFLVGTSEQALAGIHMDEVLLKSELPKKYAGYSSCFRTEAGSHGRDTKGIFRVHQFEKIEMFVFADPDKSYEEHEKMILIAEKIFQGLKIPYRIVNICTGDIGVVAAKKYDLEVWLPGQGKYREAVSCSNCTDYQARRLNAKYREKEGAPPAGLVHTLNSTAIAISRAIVAILENYQKKDGNVKVPDALVPYMSGLKEIRKC